MNTLRFLVKYLWVAVLPICLVSFVPLALSANEVGGIPGWGYWMIALSSTAVFFVTSAASGFYSWYSSKHGMAA